ncbi:MAG: EAL domain-containing protein, partial [Chitinophagaceae bacterium]|nr:EAL domain-containing protein [Rubrivivax sp.]
ESTFIGDSAAACGMLSALRGLGIRVALDDFGTGFSSLAYLQDLPIDVLKVDRSFVAGLDVGDGGASGRIVDTVVRLAHGLGARVVAEGVETTEQMEMLRRLGCDAVQGFLLGRPQRAETIPGLLALPQPQESLAIPA